ATERDGGHPEITAVLLNEQAGSSFRRAEKRMLGTIDTHRFGNSRLIFVSRFDFPTLLQFAQRQTVRRVPIDFICGCKNKRSLGAKISRRFQQIEGAVCVDREMSLWIARRPIVRWLRGGVHDSINLAAMLLE